MKMSRKEYVEKLRNMIEECSTSEEIENEMYDRLEEIDDLLFSLEYDIDEQYELKEKIEDQKYYLTSAEMENEFNYACRIGG